MVLLLILVQVGTGCQISLKNFLTILANLPVIIIKLDKLSPAYKIFFSDEVITIGDHMDKICEEFERIEAGSSKPLRAFIAKAQENYDIAINKIVLKPGLSPFELVTKETITRVDQFFKTISSEVRKNFKNPKLISTLEFPVLFFGAKPNQYAIFL